MIRYWYSLLLAVAYLGIFNVWMFLPYSWVVISSIVVSGVLLWLFIRAAKQHYFFNRWDAFLHLSVIIDILLEGVLPLDHRSKSFYLCAAAFAAVICGYRVYLRRRARTGI
jgi:hypothetical protein